MLCQKAETSIKKEEKHAAQTPQKYETAEWGMTLLCAVRKRNGDSMKIMKIMVVLFCACAACFVVAKETHARDAGSCKVALLFNIGGRGDGGFNDSAYRGLERAVASLGVKAVYVEHKRNLDLERAVKESAASDARMVIGVGYAFSEKLHSLALQYPDKKFVCVDYGEKYDDMGRIAPMPANLEGLIFREEEGSYLVGAMGALISNTGTIGFIGGMDIPVIRRFQTGYIHQFREQYT